MVAGRSDISVVKTVVGARFEPEILEPGAAKNKLYPARRIREFLSVRLLRGGPSRLLLFLVLWLL